MSVNILLNCKHNTYNQKATAPIGANQPNVVTGNANGISPARFKIINLENKIWNFLPATKIPVLSIEEATEATQPVTLGNNKITKGKNHNLLIL